MNKFWTVVKTPKKHPFQTPDTLIVNSTKLISPNAIVEIFYEYFCNLSTKLDDNIPSKRNNDFKKSLLNHNKSSMYLKPTTNFGVFNQINQLNKCKGYSYDGISAKFLKIAAKVIPPVLANLFNVSLN